MIDIEQILNSTKGIETKGKIEKLTVLKYALGFFDNEEILNILKPAKKKYKDLFGIKAGHYKIFFYLKNLYAKRITKDSDYSFLYEVEYNYLETREKFEDIDIDEFEDAFYFFLQHVKNIEKKSSIRIIRIDEFLLRFLKNKFNDEKNEFTFYLDITDNLIPKNSPEIAEEVTNYFIKESKKVSEICCIFDAQNNSLLKFAELLINSNSEKLKTIIKVSEKMMNKINLTGNITNLKIYNDKLYHFPEDISTSKKKFEDNLMKMPNLLELTTMLPMRSSVFNKEKVFENLVSGEFNLINIVSEDFTLFFSGMPQLENLDLTFSKINNNNINYSVFKKNILQIFYLQNLKELTINFEEDYDKPLLDTNNDSLTMLSKFIKECKVEHLESLKIFLELIVYYNLNPTIFKNFKDFIVKNKTVKCFNLIRQNPKSVHLGQGRRGTQFEIHPVFYTNLANKIAFDISVELLNRKNINEPCQFNGSLGSISLLFKAIMDNNSLCLVQYIDEINFSDGGYELRLPKIEEDKSAKVFSCAMKEMNNLKKLVLHLTDINCKNICNLIEIKQPLEVLTLDITDVVLNSQEFLQMFTKIPPVDTLRSIFISCTQIINEFLSILSDRKLVPNLINLQLTAGHCRSYITCDLTLLERFFKSAPNFKTFSVPTDLGQLNNHDEIKELCGKYNIIFKFTDQQC